MVDALREARRVLKRSGVLVDVRPVVAPIEVEVLVAKRAVWTKTVESYSAPEDIAAADAAMRNAVSRDGLVFGTSVPFVFEIYCHTAAELKCYAEARKLRGAEIPYEELEARRRRFRAQQTRLRCRRRWMLSTYGKR